jgi:ABC-type nitrate/sulfonate/bicarbonate transport system substrate-binding protein
MTTLTSINAGFATVGQGAGPMMVTWRAGLFEQHGLAIDRPRLMSGAKGVVRGLMAGEIQFGNLAAPAPLRANLRGEADIVFLTGGINQQFVVGGPAIRSREQLAGKKIGTVGDGGIGDMLVKFVISRLAATGITGLREEPIAHGAAAELDALLTAKVDAVVGTPPECIDAIRHGCNYVIDFAEYGFNYALGGIAARRGFVEKNPEIARSFVKAYVRGMQRYRTDREFTIHVQAEYSGVERSIAAETYDLTQPGMPRAPYPVVPALQSLLDFMAHEAPEAKNADAHRFVDDRFIRELETEGFLDALDRRT